MLYFKDNNGSISPQLSYWESWKLCLGLFSLSLSLSLSLYIYIYITWEIFMYLLVNIVNHHHLTDDGFMILLLIFLKNTLERHTLVVPSTNWLPAGYFPPTYYLNSFNPIINANVFLSSSFFSFSKSFSSSFDLLFPLTSYTLFCFVFL